VGAGHEWLRGGQWVQNTGAGAGAWCKKGHSNRTEFFSGRLLQHAVAAVPGLFRRAGIRACAFSSRGRHAAAWRGGGRLAGQPQDRRFVGGSAEKRAGQGNNGAGMELRQERQRMPREESRW